MARTIELEKSIRILAPKSWSNDQKGVYLEKIAAALLKRQSYEVLERIRFTGMEIDLLATHKPSSRKVYVECKFHDKPLGANVLDLMLGQGVRKKIKNFALFSTSTLAKEAAGAFEEIRSDDDTNFAFYGPEVLLDALTDSGLAPLPPENLPATISHATLLVYPDFPYLWLLQEQKDGRPQRLLMYGANSEDLPPADELRILLDDHGVLDGLPIVVYEADGYIQAVEETPRTVELVSEVITADDLIDYRPCRPEDFIGRLSIQNQVIDFLSDIRSARTSTRLLALVGASGFGKSSLVAKIARRLRNKSWRSKYFVFTVDVRSARGSLFVAEALLSSIRAAQASGFISPDTGSVSVDDADNVLAGESVGGVLQMLKAEDKVLMIFFDQFEEALAKDELLPLFRAFRRFALDVHSAKANLVIGFSWRTGISFSDDNPAYQMWNELRDHRLTKILGSFDSGESSKVVSQFENALSERFLPPLRRRILEQGQGLPWLLKKLCIHVYGQIKKGVSQYDLVGGRLNVSSLFDEDLEHLSEAQVACLRYIAANSPADSLDVFERFGSEVVGGLSERRLVIRAGQKFAVYWDIFRDYLNEGKVPFIPLTYLPNTTVSMALSVCKALRAGKEHSTSELAARLGYSESTIANIVTDLQNLAVCDKDQSGRHRLLPSTPAASVAQQLRNQFADHVVYQRLLAESVDGAISRKKAKDVVVDLYSSSRVKPATRDNYLSRLIPWLEYSGLLEQSGSSLKLFVGARFGARFGKELQRRRGGEQVFLGSSTPEQTLLLLSELQKAFRIPKSDVTGKRRYSASDLVALGLAFWTKSHLQFDAASERDPNVLLLSAVENDRAVKRMIFLLAEHGDGMSRAQLGVALGEALQRTWKQSSALRVANGMFGYLAYLGLIPERS